MENGGTQQKKNHWGGDKSKNENYPKTSYFIYNQRFYVFEVRQFLFYAS